MVLNRLEKVLLAFAIIGACSLQGSVQQPVFHFYCRDAPLVAAGGLAGWFAGNKICGRIFGAETRLGLMCTGVIALGGAGLLWNSYRFRVGSTAALVSNVLLPNNTPVNERFSPEDVERIARNARIDAVKAARLLRRYGNDHWTHLSRAEQDDHRHMFNAPIDDHGDHIEYDRVLQNVVKIWKVGRRKPEER